MSTLNEIDCAYYSSSQRSISTVCSMEIVDTLPCSVSDPCPKIQSPKVNRSLFEYLDEEQIETYNKLYPQISNIIQELQSVLPPVCIRDECSLQAKSVVLRVPLRRNTLVK